MEYFYSMVKFGRTILPFSSLGRGFLPRVDFVGAWSTLAVVVRFGFGFGWFDWRISHTFLTISLISLVVITTWRLFVASLISVSGPREELEAEVDTISLIWSVNWLKVLSKSFCWLLAEFKLSLALVGVSAAAVCSPRFACSVCWSLGYSMVSSPFPYLSILLNNLRRLERYFNF